MNRWTEIDGHHLACAMLREISADWSARDEAHRDAQPDEDFVERWHLEEPAILQRYLKTVAAEKSDALARGFCQVLTDFLASCFDGGVPNLEIYEEDTPAANPLSRGRRPAPPPSAGA